MSEHTAEKDALACPLCHGAAYLCTEPHADGRGARIHCREASLHNFMPDDPRILPPGDGRDPVAEFITAERALHADGCLYPEDDCTCITSPEATS